MKRLGLFFGALALCGACAGPASAAPVLIDFDTGTAGSPIGAFYSGQGLTFSNGSFQNNFGLPGTSGPLGLGDITDPVGPPFNPGPTSRIVGVFSGPVSSVSIVGVDVGADGVRIEVFDAPVGGTMIGFAQFFGIGAGVGNFGTLLVSASGIRRFEIFQPLNVLGGSDGVLFDNLAFETQAVPEPTSLALFGMTLTGAGLYRWRRRKQTLPA